MTRELGHVVAASTVQFLFTTHGSDGAPIAPSSAFEAADVRIYKNGSATERASASGVTMTSPFDSVTGLHHLAIDLSDNADAGFYAAGSTYEVVLIPDETVDSIAVTAVLARFVIGDAVVNAEVLDVLNVDTFAEPTGVPGATVTLAEKIGRIYMYLRNKRTVTSSKETVFDDGDAAEYEYDLSDDGTTFTRSEANSL